MFDLEDNPYPLFDQHTHTVPPGSCVKLRPDHCWHLKESHPGETSMQLCCWCAQWRVIEHSYLEEHGPWRAKALEREVEVTE